MRAYRLSPESYARYINVLGHVALDFGNPGATWTDDTTPRTAHPVRFSWYDARQWGTRFAGIVRPPVVRVPDVPFGC